MSCKFKKDWIMDNYSVSVRSADSRLKPPGNQPEPDAASADDENRKSEAVLTHDGCAAVMRSLPMNIFPPRKAER
jgi:hypothetical protein